MTADASVGAGWYRDPSGRYVQRWWDGASWTGHVRGHRPAPDTDTIEIAAVRATPAAAPKIAAAPAAAQRSGASHPWSRFTAPVLVCVYGGAAGVALGSIAPWVEVSSDVLSASKRGIDGDGVITVGLAVLAAILFTVPMRRRLTGMLMLGLGVVMALVAGYELFDLSNKTGDVSTTLDVSVTPGIGLLLTAVSALVVAVGGALALGEIEKPGEIDKPRRRGAR
jgi:Protein of unknown function (DUF2510)